MASHRRSGLEQRPGAYAARRRDATWPTGAPRAGRAAPAYRPLPVEATCPDCAGTGLRAASLDPYCSCVLTCRTCAGTDTHQDRTIFLMQLAFGCGIGLATLAVVLL